MSPLLRLHPDVGAGIFGLTGGLGAAAARLDRDRARSRTDSQAIGRKHGREQDRARGLRRRPSLHRHGGGRARRMGPLERPLGSRPSITKTDSWCWPPSRCRRAASNTKASRASGCAGIRSSDSPARSHDNRASVVADRVSRWIPQSACGMGRERRGRRPGRERSARGGCADRGEHHGRRAAAGVRTGDERAHTRRRGSSADLRVDRRRGVDTCAAAAPGGRHVDDGPASRARRRGHRSALARPDVSRLGRRYRAHRLVWASRRFRTAP